MLLICFRKVFRICSSLNVQRNFVIGMKADIEFCFGSFASSLEKTLLENKLLLCKTILDPTCICWFLPRHRSRLVSREEMKRGLFYQVKGVSLRGYFDEEKDKKIQQTGEENCETMWRKLQMEIKFRVKTFKFYSRGEWF